MVARAIRVTNRSIGMSADDARLYFQDMPWLQEEDLFIMTSLGEALPSIDYYKS